MDINATEEDVAAAQAYESLHVPALFSRWPPHVAKTAQIESGQRVLDVACGTGTLARHIAPLVGINGSVTGINPGAGMLAIAKNLAPSIEWQQGTAEALPYDDESYDAVVSQFGLMFFQDRIAALRDMLRVLVPGGRIAVAVWDSLENSEAYPLEVELFERLAGEHAAEAMRAPFALGNPNELATLFEEAGAESVSVATYHETAKFPSIRAMVEADLRGWLPIMGVDLDETLIQTILAEAEEVLSQYRTADGNVEFDAPAHIVSAKKSL
ncbi:MAG: methyltransferase domain-containing protein [Pseudomonadales bacterium]